MNGSGAGHLLSRRQALAGAAATAAFAACAPEKAADAKAVRLQLNWLPEAEHGGYYQILADKLLDGLSITGGASGMAVETEVAAGRADFGIVAADKLLQVTANGLPLVPLFAAIQDNPRCLVVKADSPLQTFPDLSRAKALSLNSALPFYAWLLHLYPELAKAPAIPYNPQLFLSGRAEAIQGYINAEPLVFAAQKVQTTALMVSATGFNPYAGVLVCSRTTLEKRPELVASITAAARQGWERYIKDCSSGTALIAAANPHAAPTLQASALALAPLCRPPAGAAPGHMSRQRWIELHAQLITCKVLPPGTPAPTWGE